MDYISLDEENRCGYLVSSKLKKIWNVEIELLLELLKVCEKYNLRVFLWAGTLLGAVRHKGFIPWDDDLDVALPREDYEKLVAVADKEFNHPFFFQTALNDSKFFFGHARLRNSNTTGLITWNKSEDYNNGIYIDVYVLDGYIDNQFMLFKQLILKEIYAQILSCYYADDSYRCKKPQWIISFIKKIGNRKTYDYWYGKYIKNLCKYNDVADKRSVMHDNYRIIKENICKVEDLKSIVFCEFEGYKAPIPQNYDTILKCMYGDYNTLPPVEERGKWHNNMIVFDPDIPYKEYLKNMQRKK